MESDAFKESGKPVLTTCFTGVTSEYVACGRLCAGPAVPEKIL